MTRSAYWLAAGVLLWVVFATIEAKAGIGFQPISAEELSMKSEPLAPGAPAIILYRQLDRDDNVHTPHEDNYFRIKILTEEGRKHADVEIPFFKDREDIANIHARTIRPDGSVADFGGKVYEKYLVKGKFRGRELKVLAKTFTLSDVQVGSILEYSFTRDFNEYTLYDSRWILTDDLFTKKAQFSLKPFNDNYYGNYSLRWTWNALPPGATPPKQSGNRFVTMEAVNIPGFQTEDYMPPEEELKSRVDFIYEEGISVKDQAGYWKDFGKKRNGQLEGFVGKHKALAQALAQIISPNDTPETKLRKIYDRVQQLRNTTYEVQKTEQEQKRAKEKTFENVNAEDIWKRGYGNGVDLTWLFLGFARAAGFEAYGCWVSGRNQFFFTPVTMQSSKLNANVVLVKVNGKDMYFDPGGAFTPFGLLEWSETGVTGLKLDKDGGTWIQTTLPQPQESQILRTGKLKLSETGDLEGRVSVTYTGLEAMYNRLDQRHADDVARKKFLEEQVTATLGGAAQLELNNKPDWNSSETPLVAEFDLKIPGWASSAGKHVVAPAALFTAEEKGMFEHANRIHPVYFEYPHEKLEDLQIELPAGWQVSSVPKTSDQDGHVVHYILKPESGPGTLHLSRRLSIDLMELEQKYYLALRNFFQVVRSDDAEQVVLQPGGLHANN